MLVELLLLCAFLAVASARADARAVLLPTSGSPVLFVQVQTGIVKVRSWNQQSVRVNASANIQIKYAPPWQVQHRLPSQVMLWSQAIQTRFGRLVLPAEAFPLPNVNEMPHDAVVVRGQGYAAITVPAGTALVVVNMRRGSVWITGYNGVFVSHIGRGQLHLRRVGGTGAVQVNNGPVFAADSSFDRLRVRTARGNIMFSNCSAAQIEVTSLTGSILYDNGTFEPGLARFESARGAVALGIGSGGAQVVAHSTSGRVIPAVGQDVPIGGTRNNVQAMFSGGGPVVTATSGSGNVFFYTGALRDHPDLQRRLRWPRKVP
jgi:hypothetical protein